MAPQIDADRIADRDEIDAGAVGDARDRRVPGDHADALLAVALHLLKRGDGDFGGHGGHREEPTVVMPGLVRASTPWLPRRVDGRDKPGHERWMRCSG